MLWQPFGRPLGAHVAQQLLMQPLCVGIQPELIRSQVPVAGLAPAKRSPMFLQYSGA